MSEREKTFNFDADISIHPFSDAKITREMWDELVRTSDNGTMFHLRKFLSYHPEGRFEDHSLYVMRNEKLFAVFPAIKQFRDGKWILNSHGGASYGGFVYPAQCNIRDAFLMIECLLEYVKKNDFAGIQITLPPMMYAKHLSNYLDFALVKNGFSYLKREISSIVDLRNPNVIESEFRPEARTALNKARKSGIVIKQSSDYSAYYDILKNNLRMRHGVQPTHSLEELIDLAQRFPQEITLWGAYLEDRMIAGVCTFAANQEVILAFYISHDDAFQEYRAVNLLFATIMEESAKQGFSYLDFGIFTVNMDPNWGLGRFKENFGSRGIFRDTFIKYM
jgi:hypothetical protein